jgi:chromosome segregation ATPase
VQAGAREHASQLARVLVVRCEELERIVHLRLEQLTVLHQRYNDFFSHAQDAAHAASPQAFAQLEKELLALATSVQELSQRLDADFSEKAFHGMTMLVRHLRDLSADLQKAEGEVRTMQEQIRKLRMDQAQYEDQLHRLRESINDAQTTPIRVEQQELVLEKALESIKSKIESAEQKITAGLHGAHTDVVKLILKQKLPIGFEHLEGKLRDALQGLQDLRSRTSKEYSSSRIMIGNYNSVRENLLG